MKNFWVGHSSLYFAIFTYIFEYNVLHPLVKKVSKIISGVWIIFGLPVYNFDYIFL